VLEDEAGSRVNTVGVRDHDFGEMLSAAGRVLLAPLRLVAWLGHVCFRAGWFFVFRLPIALAGVLFLAFGALVIVSVIDHIYEHNHDPALRLREKEAFVVTLRQADERNDRENRARGLPPVRPEDRLAPPVESQIAELKAEIGKQRAARGGAQ
jgi:hypothetical protein